MHEYAFDITLAAAVRVTASSEAEARKKLKGHFDCADCNSGMVDDKPMTFEASLSSIDFLYEVDGVETEALSCK